LPRKRGINRKERKDYKEKSASLRGAKATKQSRKIVYRNNIVDCLAASFLAMTAAVI
jgi:hypothetical protein